MRRSMWICSSLLILVFASLAWLAARTKCATFDEPYHAMAGWVQLYRDDFRLDPQNGALWHDWCALGTGPVTLRADFQSSDFTSIPKNLLLQWDWCIETLYRTSGNNADAFIGRQRVMSLLLAVVLAILIARWSAILGGTLATVVALTLYCFDPNFLAHATLVKNDVPFALIYFAFAMSVWRGGQSLTWMRFALIAILMGIAVTIKSTGVLLAPLLVFLFAARSLAPASWWMLGRNRSSRVTRSIASFIAVIAIGLCTWGFVWMVYGFRFAPTADRSVLLDMGVPTRLAVKAEYVIRTGNHDPSETELASSAPSSKVLAILWMQDHRVLPQAFLNGLLYQYEANLLRNNYLLGEVSLIGKWQYFPLAILFKTATATLLITALSLIPLIWFARSIRWRSFHLSWTFACLTIPPFGYLLFAMVSNVNVGIRHVLVVYPFAYVGIGYMANEAWHRWPVYRFRYQVVGGVLALGLLTETALAFPDFIPFFNFPTRSLETGTPGLELLGDSNLDWGQDLKGLADWQRLHMGETLYLSYFGMADPAYYGIHYINLPGGYSHGPKFSWPGAPGVIAVSASNLQGFLLPPRLYYQLYEPFRHQQPIKIIGGSIYLYRFPPDAQHQIVPPS